MPYRGGLVILVAYLAAMGSDTSPPPLSAVRLPNETYEQARARALNQAPESTLLDSESAANAAVPYDEIDLQKLAPWKNQTQLWKAFIRGRDERFLTGTVGNVALRRSSWLFPDDGCYARAALFADHLRRWKFPETSKLFAFGTLEIKSANSPRGSVQWWYHAAPGVRIGRKAFVWDPAIEPARPLLFSEWVTRMRRGAKDNLAISICNSETYLPTDPCTSPASAKRQTMEAHQKPYLDQEWNRLRQLRRDPEKELGDDPPWKQISRIYQ